MKIFYTDSFVLPLPETHRFPMQKYALARKRVTDARLVPAESMCVPEEARDDEILLAHDADYLAKVVAGELTRKEVLRMGFPWSPQLVERSRRSVGATIAACREAMNDGAGVNLAGGTHHAFRDCGEGYCVLNDAVIAARVLQRDGQIRRVAIVDCDVHQGNGTAAIADGDESIFTFSIHGAKNFPARKETSDLDVPLADGTGDDDYLRELENGLQRTIKSGRPDLAIYLAGADPYENDRLGRLSLTKAGLAERDRMVFECCRSAGVPVAITMSGGYAPVVDDTVDIHFGTVRTAVEMFGG